MILKLKINLKHIWGTRILQDTEYTLRFGMNIKGKVDNSVV